MSVWPISKRTSAHLSLRPISTSPGYVGWVTVRLPMTRSEVEIRFGPECKTYKRGCAVCDVWHSWGHTGMVSVLFDYNDLLNVC